MLALQARVWLYVGLGLIVPGAVPLFGCDRKESEIQKAPEHIVAMPTRVVAPVVDYPIVIAAFRKHFAKIWPLLTLEQQTRFAAVRSWPETRTFELTPQSCREIHKGLMLPSRYEYLYGEPNSLDRPGTCYRLFTEDDGNRLMAMLSTELIVLTIIFHHPAA